MKEKMQYIIFIIVLIILTGLVYKITYSKTLALIPVLMLIFYLLENRNKIFGKEENI